MRNEFKIWENSIINLMYEFLLKVTQLWLLTVGNAWYW